MDILAIIECHSDPENLLEYYNERAAIYEYEAGMNRDLAEKEAAKSVGKRIKKDNEMGLPGV